MYNYQEQKEELLTPIGFNAYMQIKANAERLSNKAGYIPNLIDLTKKLALGFEDIYTNYEPVFDQNYWQTFQDYNNQYLNDLCVGIYLTESMGGIFVYLEGKDFRSKKFRAHELDKIVATLEYLEKIKN